MTKARQISDLLDGLEIDGTVTADAVNVAPTTGYANIEMGGPDGAYIDLKSPFSDDYDGRIITNGTGLAITTGSGSGSVILQHQNATKLSTTSTGLGVTGNVKLDADNAGIQLKSGVTGTEGLIKWTFNTDDTVYAQAGITFNNRATDGFLLDVGYPITLDATTDIKFKIAGSEEMRLEADGDLHVDGNVIAYSTTISDKRLKKDIAPIDNALWKVSQLNGCTFTYLKDDRKSAGLIAQDLEKVLPSAVIEDEAVFHGEEGETYKTVQYDQVIGLLVEAVKELTAKVEELENASTK